MLQTTIHRARPGWLPALAMCALLGGCGEQRPPSEYEIIAGTVEGARPDTGLLTVRTNDEPQRRLSSVFTKDSELYLDDRFSPVSAIQIGDEIELIGYYDPNPRSDGFVVSIARIRRNVPIPPPPEIAIPAVNQPQPEEN